MKFHLHLLVDAELRNPPTDPKVLIDWFDRLIVALGMEKFGGPWAKYCDDPANRGITGQAWLTTSHTSIHIWDNCETPFCKFDVYSCREYDIDTVMNLFKEFQPISGVYTLINRTTKIPSITQGDISKYLNASDTDYETKLSVLSQSESAPVV